MDTNLTFIYDGECPFCNHFAELLELKSKINNITILDGRKNPKTINYLLDKGYDIDNGAILLKGDDIFHGAEAINRICNQIDNPSGKLLKILSNRELITFGFFLPSRIEMLFILLLSSKSSAK